ncbi:MATH domain-containing protein [Acorus calamus]|uniref:MATH domain-containing protein n=1 Tax=Acorus calamus TaxID=4465 RepID=A0AAV9EQL5_ACOCL|nr:MATH domain-containing protein [Acorus calamus]
MALNHARFGDPNTSTMFKYLCGCFVRKKLLTKNSHRQSIFVMPQGRPFLRGWSHFAQFTIAVVNKDPKKSKYSDTLHRFWKKEHDWGWKKFMELSKVLDGFIVADTLVIKAQVQVIRPNLLAFRSQGGVERPLPSPPVVTPFNSGII